MGPKTLAEVNTSLVSWVIRHMWQTAQHIVYMQRTYKWVYTVKYSSLILSIGLHVRGSNQLLESRKGGRGGHFTVQEA